jgi:hypothetical protein
MITARLPPANDAPRGQLDHKVTARSRSRAGSHGPATLVYTDPQSLNSSPWEHLAGEMFCGNLRGCNASRRP